MSQDDFFGRTVPRGFSSFEIEICEVCQRKTPKWIEVNSGDAGPEIRLTCDTCHDDFIQVNDTLLEQNYTREIKDDELEGRPKWVKEFIQEQDESGSIENIETVQVESSSPDLSFSEAPSTFSNVKEENEEYTDYTPIRIASWAPQFIQESLFGPDPIVWLKKEGSFSDDSLEITMQTLQSFKDHNISSVKLSAIKGLFEVYKGNKQHKDGILKILNYYKEDDDETISNYVDEIINQII